MPKNLEIKTPFPDLDRGHAISRALGARDGGVLNQCDTYFNSTQGRVKLREIEGSHAELIFYQRLEATGERECNYQIFRTADPAQLLAVIGPAMGVRTIVRKSRYLYLYENARIHLDAVEGLGNFLEFEVVVDERGMVQAQELLNRLIAAFELDRAEFIQGSYVDMMTGG